MILAISILGGFAVNLLIGGLVVALLDRHADVFDWSEQQPSQLALLAAVIFWPRILVRAARSL